MNIGWTLRAATFLWIVLIHPWDTQAQSVAVVDWMAIDVPSRTVTGSLSGTPVTLSWSPSGNVPATYFQGGAPWFNSIAFTPPFESTDGMEIVARHIDQEVPSYTIVFGAPVSDPVLHLGSLASSLAFVGAMPRRVSGDTHFVVSGNAVSGAVNNEPNGIDSNGTIAFSGSFSSLTFTAAYSGPPNAGVDGITIQVGAMPGSRLVGLEVVQVVQDWRNSVPLVAGKKAVVRAHLSKSVDQPASGHVEAELWAFNAQGQPMIPPFIRNGPDRLGETLQLPWLVNETTRNSLNASINFHLPDEWLVPGVRTFLFQSPAGVPAATCAEFAPPIADDCAVSVEFAARQAIVVQALRTQFQDTKSAPLECSDTGGQFVAGTCTYVSRNADLTAACNRIRTEMPTHEVICKIDQNPIFLPPAEVRPTADEVMALVLQRKQQRCPRCDDFYLAVTAFWSSDGAVGLAYPPIAQHDTYRTAWATAARLSPGAIEHEIGHNLGVDHPSFDDAVPNDDYKQGTCGESADEEYAYQPFGSYFFPFYHDDLSGNWPRLGPILENDLELLVYGFDTLERRVVSYLTSSQMSYCGTPWVRSQWTDSGSYGAQFDALTPSVAFRDGTTGNLAEYFWLSGDWNRATDSARFDPIQIAAPPVVPPVPASGVLELVTHSSTMPDVVQPLVPNGSSEQPNRFSFHAWVLRSPGITGFTLRRNGVVLAETHVSAQAPQISIIGPAPGNTYLGEDITLSWTAADNDGDPLAFRIEYSIDGGTTWEMLSSNWQTTSFVVNANLLLSTPIARFRVTALDGFLSTTAVMPGTIAVINSAIFDSGFE